MTYASDSLQPILVVDDDSAIRQLLGKALEREGYLPVLCADADEALSIFEKESFALAFVDINLPGMSGLELASGLKRMRKDCEIVFITGSGSFENAVQAIKIGAYDYLRKPLSISDFILCLKRFQQRQVLRERIQFAEQRYSRLVQTIPTLIYALDRNFRLDFVNKACRTMLGYSRKEAMAEPGWLLKRVHADDRDRVGKAFESAFAMGRPVSLECRLIHKDGRLLHAILKSIMEHRPEAGGDAQRLEGFIVDITDRISLEKALIQREKFETLGAISAEVAHEIRNPLVIIGGFARRLKQRFQDLYECDVILRESERLERILSRISSYLKPVEIHPTECSVNALLNDCLVSLANEIQQADVSCKLDLDPSLTNIYLDPDILRQVFINLIQNALATIPPKSVFHIISREEVRNQQIRFENTVIESGIAREKARFLPFAENVQSPGMPLTYRLLKDIGGLMSYHREKDMTCYTVTLPKTMHPNGGTALR